MNKKWFTNIILAAVVIFSFTGISRVYAVSVAPILDYGKIEATILDINYLKEDPQQAYFGKIRIDKVLEYSHDQRATYGALSVEDTIPVYFGWGTKKITVNGLNLPGVKSGDKITVKISGCPEDKGCGNGWTLNEYSIIQSPLFCEIGKIYDNTAVNPVSCSCPAGYQFETIEIGWGPCPAVGISDCPATKLRCVAKTGVPTGTNEPVSTSTSAPVKIEVTATETAISGPQPTTAKLPVGCTRENETVTCPTSETKQISVPVMMSTNAPLEAITIQKQTDGTIGITSHEAIAVTTEKVTVEGNRLFIGPTESAKPVSVLPNQAKDTAIASAGLTSVAIIELKTEEQKPIYTIQGARSSKLLFFIPVSIKTTTKIDATSGKVISIQKPWWNFLTR